jgi:hypothetical protein
MFRFFIFLSLFCWVFPAYGMPITRGSVSNTFPSGLCRIQKGETFCTGALIGNRIITAEHALVGQTVTSIVCSGIGEIPVSEIESTHFFSEQESLEGALDLGFLTLKRSYSTQIMIHRFEGAQFNEAIRLASAAGDLLFFGYGGNGLQDVILRQPTLGDSAMGLDGLIVFVEEDGWSVAGDSGGPLLIRMGNAYFLVGVDQGQIPLFPFSSAFTRIDGVFNWLLPTRIQQTNASCSALLRKLRQKLKFVGPSGPLH